MIYEILNDDGDVINIIVAEPDVVEELYPNHYRLVPEPEPVPQPVTIISRYAFRSRFTVDEKQAIYTEGETNIDIKIWLDDLSSAEAINLTTEETIATVNNLATLGLIDQYRVAEILSTSP